MFRVAVDATINPRERDGLDRFRCCPLLSSCPVAVALADRTMCGSVGLLSIAMLPGFAKTEPSASLTREDDEVEAAMRQQNNEAHEQDRSAQEQVDPCSTSGATLLHDYDRFCHQSIVRPQMRSWTRSPFCTGLKEHSGQCLRISIRC